MSSNFDYCSKECAEMFMQVGYDEDFSGIIAQLQDFHRDMVEVEVAFLKASFMDDYIQGFYEAE